MALSEGHEYEPRREQEWFDAKFEALRDLLTEALVTLVELPIHPEKRRVGTLLIEAQELIDTWVEAHGMHGSEGVETRIGI